jgi:hypothetical protein
LFWWCEGVAFPWGTFMSEIARMSSGAESVHMYFGRKRPKNSSKAPWASSASFVAKGKQSVVAEAIYNCQRVALSC